MTKVFLFVQKMQFLIIKKKKTKKICDKCKQCGFCFPVCPVDAIRVNKDGNREDFNFDYCKGCGVCAKVCPFNAIEMKNEGE